MLRYTTHVCLVSQDEELNITPTLHAGFKPDNVLLIYTRWHKEKAHNLSLIFNQHKINTRFLEIINKQNVPHISQLIRQAIEQILVDNKDTKNKVVLNITGGSQLLALLSHEIFNELKLPVFYVNKETDIVHFLPLKQQQSHQFHLDDRLKIKDYLLAYGIKAHYRISAQSQSSIADNHKKLALTLIENIEQYQKPLAKFNYYAGQTNKSFQAHINHNDLKDSNFMNLIHLFVDLDIIHFTGKTLDFSNEANRFFCNGGWLEEYIFQQLSELKETLSIQDIMTGLEIELPCGSKNEIDVAFMANNRFYLIECKTKKYSGHAAGNNTLYKLDTLKHYGSNQSKAMLISYHRLTNSNRRRADDYQLKIISAHKIKQLKALMVEWLNG